MTLARRLSIALGIPLALIGCQAPVSVKVASYAIDAVSYLATEKTVTDHGISLALAQDCALSRPLKGQAICTDMAEGGKTDVAEKKPPADAGLADAGMGDSEARKLAEFETAAGTPAETSGEDLASRTRDALAEKMPVALTRSQGEHADLFYVLSSFANRDNAENFGNQYAEFAPVILTVVIEGREMHRVMVGPFEPSEQALVKKRLTMAGIAQPWSIRLAHWTLVLSPYGMPEMELKKSG